MNALAEETSPYLLQHRDNPVDWLPWGETALARAKQLDRPILVSIGYSACHWCHVMAHESFEDAEVAAVMNEHFVCVKVDREERPDVDAIYMEAIQAMTGHGGWPLNVFLTPDQTPFYGGTYFPPVARSGMPSWRDVLVAVAEVWRERPAEARAAGARMAERLGGAARLTASDADLRRETLDDALTTLRGSYDNLAGGFGGAPKFPPHATLELLLRLGEREMSLHTLRAMATGGINDQIGGGFARYAVDRSWTVPHFEKMLYDNALLARTYLHAWQLTREPLFERTTRETLDFCLRELRMSDGGFASALDADSEGVEGRFYAWTLEELRDVLGPLADPAIAHFGATASGNFEGTNVLEARGPALEERETVRAMLLARRDGRVRPGLDDKRLTSWNALAIAALADGAAVLGEERYLTAAIDTADFVLRELRDDAGRLLRTYNAGRPKLRAYLEDHAFLLEALLTLYEACFDERYFIAARELADAILARFADATNGGFFMTADDHEALITRRKDLEDAPIPSGSSSAAFGLLRLAALSGEQHYADAALGALRLVQEFSARAPIAFAHALCALDFYTAPARELAIVGPEREALEAAVRSRPRPHLVLAAREHTDAPTEVALLEDREPIGDRAAAYLCERFTCRTPVTEPQELLALLGDRPVG